jgi:TRAP-type mannitol/chloroaromatic compound transport system permease large subunit
MHRLQVMMLFVMKGVAPEDISIKDICWAALPFILCDMVAMTVIIAWPPPAPWLPGLTG